jgi:hypothetical protein
MEKSQLSTKHKNSLGKKQQTKISHNVLEFHKDTTIVITFDLEFYVPPDERADKNGFQANPYRKQDFLIGGTFITYYPLDDKKKPCEKQFWIWNYKNEKEMLVDIILLFQNAWKITKEFDNQRELIVTGIGISRIDIAYLFGRCVVNDVETTETLFSILNRLRIVDLECVTIPYFKSNKKLLYPKNTKEINVKFNINRKRESGKTIWDYYDKKDFGSISERNLNEVRDQLTVYRRIAHRIFVRGKGQN